MSILIVAGHDDKTLSPATRSAVTAALATGDRDLHVLVAGQNCAAVAEQAAAIEGVSRVLLADDDACAHHLAENIAPLVQQVSAEHTHIMAPATTAGKDIMPRVAALLNVDQISDIIAVESPDTFKRPVYAGNAIATVQSSAPVKVITVRATAFDAAPDGGSAAPVEPVEVTFRSGKVAFAGEHIEVSERPELTAAKVVVSGGRGLGSAENFELVYRLADKLGAAVGASRAAVDAGYVPNDMQVGQTGKVVAPALYIAVGISGAIQHLAGMKDSGTIVAINKDPEAPIFEVADYGLTGDLFAILPELTEKL